MCRFAHRLLAAVAVTVSGLGVLPSIAADPAPTKPHVESATESYGSDWLTVGIAANRKEEADGDLNGGLLEWGNWFDSHWKYMTVTLLGSFEYRSGGAQDYFGLGISGSFLVRGGPFRIGPRLGVRTRYRDSDPHSGWGLSAGPGLETGFLIKQRYYFGVFWEYEFDTSVPTGNLYGISFRWNFTEGEAWN